MKFNWHIAVASLSALFAACATPPTSDPSTVDPACAHQCSAELSTCSSGFKLFPVVEQKHCNDTYDVCIRGCPARSSPPSASQIKHDVSERLKTLDDLLKAGTISKEEYDAKRKQVLESL